MTPEQSFNRRIKRFLTEQPQSTASTTIRQVVMLNPGHKNYYSLFDSFSFRLGIGIIAQGIINKNGKTIGYVPSIKYYPGNSLKEEPRVESLISETAPLSLSRCYEYLAKELLYRIMRVPDLNSLIKKTTTSP